VVFGLDASDHYNESKIFRLKLLFLCRSQETADELDEVLLDELSEFLGPNNKGPIYIDSCHCGNPGDTFISDLDEYEKFSEWDYLTDLGENKWPIN
jgi:hypothetical protein